MSNFVTKLIISLIALAAVSRGDIISARQPGLPVTGERFGRVVTQADSESVTPGRTGDMSLGLLASNPYIPYVKIASNEPPATIQPRNLLASTDNDLQTASHYALGGLLLESAGAVISFFFFHSGSNDIGSAGVGLGVAGFACEIVALVKVESADSRLRSQLRH
jgi:hypothetical protein